MKKKNITSKKQQPNCYNPHNQNVNPFISTEYPPTSSNYKPASIYPTSPIAMTNNMPMPNHNKQTRHLLTSAMDQITQEITHQNKTMQNTLKKYYHYRQKHKTQNNSNNDFSEILQSSTRRVFGGVKRDNSGTKVRNLLSQQKSLLNNLETIKRESVSISKQRNRRTYCMSSLATYSG